MPSYLKADFRPKFSYLFSPVSNLDLLPQASGNLISWLQFKTTHNQLRGVASAFEPLMSEHDVARICGLSDAAVRRWRLLRKGPRYIKIGSAARYRLDDVRKWLETRPTGGEGIR